MIFLDTSAIYAWSDSGDLNHEAAVQRLGKILAAGEQLLTHNYVVLEAFTLLQARLGISGAAKFAADCAAFEIEWIDQDLHDSGIRELTKAGRRHVSLVDHISFLVMNRRGLTRAFAFDPHFKTQGFRLFEP